MNKKSSNNNELSASSNFFHKVLIWYHNQPILRSTLQQYALQNDISCFGPIDTFLSGLGAHYQSNRVQDFLTDLDLRVKRIEGRFDLPTIQPTEEWIDFIIQVIDYVHRSRSEEKRQRFAQLVINQCIHPRHWDEAEIACRMIGELTDHHIKMLDLTLKAPVSQEVHKGHRVVTLFAEKYFDGQKGIVHPNIRNHFLQLDDRALEMIVSELAARGLLRDVGVGGFGGGIYMAFFEATELAQWLMDWIAEPKNMPADNSEGI